MAIVNDFSNIVFDEKEKKRVIEKLTELYENDRNSIYNLIFSEREDSKAEE